MEYIILDDLFGIKLWGENIFRRVYHHLSNNNFNPRKTPLLYEVKQILTDDQIAYLQGLTFEKDTALNTTKWSLLLGGQYSPRDTLYFNNMDKDLQTKLEEMGNSLIPNFESLLGTKLKLGDTNFRAILLRYEGANAQFGFHYDTEHPDCFRSLILYDGAGTIPPFCYQDGTLKKVYFQVKDGILFRGTTTHHGVEPSNDSNTKRYMVGFQYIKAESDQIEQPTLCNQLRGTSIQTILQLFIPYSMYYQITNYLPTIGFPISLSIFAIGFTSPVNTMHSVALFYLFCCFMTFDARLALHITAYILLSERFNQQIGKNK
jgi:hypothetical protein